MPLGYQLADHLLDGDIYFRHQVDRPLLSNLECSAGGFPLNLACAADGVDRGLEPGLVGRPGGHNVAFASFFTIRTSMPPSGGRRSVTSSMKLRIRKLPRPLDFSMFSGARGSATSSGSKPSPSSRTLMVRLPDSGSTDVRNSIRTSLLASLRFPCLMAL